MQTPQHSIGRLVFVSVVTSAHRPLINDEPMNAMLESVLLVGYEANWLSIKQPLFVYGVGFSASDATNATVQIYKQFEKYLCNKICYHHLLEISNMI